MLCYTRTDITTEINIDFSRGSYWRPNQQDMHKLEAHTLINFALLPIADYHLNECGLTALQWQDVPAPSSLTSPPSSVGRAQSY